MNSYAIGCFVAGGRKNAEIAESDSVNTLTACHFDAQQNDFIEIRLITMIGIPAEYARHRKEAGLSGPTNESVFKAIETGRIEVLPDGRIDFEAADIQWEKNTQKHANHHGNLSPVNPSNDGESPKQLNWADHRTRREAAEANLKEIELAKRRDELIDRKGAELAAQVTARTLRDTLIETLPSKLAVELAAITDPWALECKLRESIRAELHAILDHLTEASDVAQSRAA